MASAVGKRSREEEEESPEEKALHKRQRYRALTYKIWGLEKQLMDARASLDLTFRSDMLVQFVCEEVDDRIQRKALEIRNSPGAFGENGERNLRRAFHRLLFYNAHGERWNETVETQLRLVLDNDHCATDVASELAHEFCDEALGDNALGQQKRLTWESHFMPLMAMCPKEHQKDLWDYQIGSWYCSGGSLRKFDKTIWGTGTHPQTEHEFNEGMKVFWNKHNKRTEHCNVDDENWKKFARVTYDPTCSRKTALHPFRDFWKFNVYSKPVTVLEEAKAAWEKHKNLEKGLVTDMKPEHLVRVLFNNEYSAQWFLVKHLAKKFFLQKVEEHQKKRWWSQQVTHLMNAVPPWLQRELWVFLYNFRPIQIDRVQRYGKTPWGTATCQ